MDGVRYAASSEAIQLFIDLQKLGPRKTQSQHLLSTRTDTAGVRCGLDRILPRSVNWNTSYYVVTVGRKLMG